MSLPAIYTEKNNCQDCYKCVRECPVKAIKIEDNRASIIHELCIFCGHCTRICPAGAKKIRNDCDQVKQLLYNSAKNKEHVILALAPSYVTHFDEDKITEILCKAKKIGFYGVSETAIGAEIVSSLTKKWFATKKSGIHISSSCPAVVNLITKYYPTYTKAMTPFHSPMTVHSMILKKIYGENIKIVFVGPCPAKKEENKEIGNCVDVVLTFRELEQILDATSDENKEQCSFIPYKAGCGVLYPIEGGMLAGLKDKTDVVDTSMMSFSGYDTIKKVLNNLDINSENKMFIELLSCEGGCVNGSGADCNDSMITKRNKIISNYNSTANAVILQDKLPKLEEKDIFRVFNTKAVEVKEYSEIDIKLAMSSIGKHCEDDELNCGGCGYESCRSFIKAFIDGKAEREMCVSYMRKVAQDKFSVLLQKMPYGVVIIDEKMKIVECNRNYASVFGSEVTDLFDEFPGMRGADITKVSFCHSFFKKLLISGEESISKDYIDKEHHFNLSVFTVQKHKIVCGIIRNMHIPEIKREEVLRKTRQVIKQNLSTVQKVAYLLGENASSEESMLNSILTLYSDYNK